MPLNRNIKWHHRLLLQRPGWMLAGLLLICISLAAGMVLLGLSGWFITASALAGAGLLLGLDIFTPGAGIRMAAVVRTASRYAERLVTHEATFRALADVRDRLFAQLLRLPPSQQRRLAHGETLNRFVHDINQLDHLFLGVVGPTVAAWGLTVTLSLILFWWVDPTIGATVLGVMLVAQTVSATWIAHRGAASSHHVIHHMGALRRHLAETLETLENVLAMDRVARVTQQAADHSDALICAQKWSQTWDNLGMGLSMLLSAVGLMAVLILGIDLYHAGRIDGPWLGLIVLLLLGLTEVWQPIASAWRRLSETRLAGERIEALGTPEPAPKPLALTSHDAWLIDRVSFRYPDTEINVIEQFSATIERGEKVLLVGPSGCGKTTLAKLLMGELTPTAGTVSIQSANQHTDLQTCGPARVGYLSQDPVLFSDTLGNNLRMAKPHASDQALLDALKSAGLGERYAQLEDGLDAWIEENATNLSGGEARRVALARLMLADPELVILDEPNTGLDETTNQALNESLNAWLTNKTAVIITHQPAQAPRADRVLRWGE